MTKVAWNNFHQMALTLIVCSFSAACNACTAADCRHTSVDIWKYCSINHLNIICRGSNISISRGIWLPHDGCIDRRSLAACCRKQRHTHTLLIALRCFKIHLQVHFPPFNIVMARYGRGGKRWIWYDPAQNIAIQYDTIQSKNAPPYVVMARYIVSYRISRYWRRIASYRISL